MRAIIAWIYSLPLTAQQQAVMLVHAHHCDYWNGRNSHPSPATIAARIRLKTPRRVQQIHRELQADPTCQDCRFTSRLRDPYGRSVRCPCHLLERGPLVQETPGHGNYPPTYRLNLDLRPWGPVQLPITDPRLNLVSTASTASTGAPISREIGDFDPEISPGGTPKFRPGYREILGGAIRKTVGPYKNRGDLNTAQAPRSDNYSPQDLQDWLSIKKALKSHLSDDEWKLWVRPARLLWTMKDRVCMVIALPPDGRILEAMIARKRMALEVAATFGRALLWTRYPDDYEIERIREEFGRDLRRKPITGVDK